MHPHHDLVSRLFMALDRHDDGTIAGCYHESARFRDIAFDLHSRREIHCMWRMICLTTDLRATFRVLDADDAGARVSLVDHYTFRQTGRKVRNEIESRFTFCDGLILSHEDVCDPVAWGAMALGGVRGILAGRIRLLRSRAAARLLAEFRSAHPESC
jgi:hypothetical protein